MASSYNTLILGFHASYFRSLQPWYGSGELSRTRSALCSMGWLGSYLDGSPRPPWTFSTISLVWWDFSPRSRWSEQEIQSLTFIGTLISNHNRQAQMWLNFNAAASEEHRAEVAARSARNTRQWSRLVIVRSDEQTSEIPPSTRPRHSTWRGTSDQSPSTQNFQKILNILISPLKRGTLNNKNGVNGDRSHIRSKHRSRMSYRRQRRLFQTPNG